MKTRTIFFTLGLCTLLSCVNRKQVVEYPVVANIKLDETILAVSVVADKLEVPWDIQFLDDHQIIYTEIAGQISKLDLNTGKKTLLYDLEDVYHKRTLGLLGMAVHPNLKENPYIFISYTIKNEEGIFSKLVRLTLADDTLSDPKILQTIPGSTGHNGARLAFSKDGQLLWATGDAHSKTFAQDSTSLNGKILRINTDGSVPKDNPIPNSLVYAWGFRNMQGLTVSDKGIIYTSEHGDAIEDEVNLVKPLQNYGWPQIEGMHDLPTEIAIAEKHQRTEPIRSWTPVIAPAGLAFYNGTTIPEWKDNLLLVTLKSQSLRSLKLDDSGQKITQEYIFLEKKFGRLRAVAVSPSGDVYLTTSNQDWNPQPGFPKADDDKILRLSPVKKAVHEPLTGKMPTTLKTQDADGATLYSSYCESCHKEKGQGVAGFFPPLAGAEKAIGSPEQLIDITLNGRTEEVTIKGVKYDQPMPAFNFLKDEEIAKILTYVRSNFGNKSPEVTASQIDKRRK